MEDNKNNQMETEEIIADAIISSFSDEIKEIEENSPSDEQIAEAIIVGASTLAGLDEDESDEKKKEKKPKKITGAFFFGLGSVFSALACIICCCTPLAFPICLPIQLFLLVLSITLFILDKKYNGKTGFSISALVSIIFSICIVIIMLCYVGGMLVVSLGIKPLITPIINDYIISPIAQALNINI